MNRRIAEKEAAIHCVDILNIINADTLEDRAYNARLALEDAMGMRSTLLKRGASDKPSPNEVTEAILTEIGSYEGTLPLLLAHVGALTAATYQGDEDGAAASYLDLVRLYEHIILLEKARG